MRRLSRALVVFYVIGAFRSGESFAQGGWFTQTSPPYVDINSVMFVENLDYPHTAVAVDSSGNILRALDVFPFGLGRWEIQYSAAAGLHDLSFFHASGTAVGDQGIILRTTNRGATWTPQLSGTDANLNSVSFVDLNTGTAVGDAGTILHTTDGGDTWTPQSGDTLATLFGVAFADADHGMAVGDFGTILYTADGGATWTARKSGATVALRGISFRSLDIAFAVGDFGTILSSPDGGGTWTQLPSVPMAHLAAISFSTTFNDALTVGCTVSAGGDCENSGIVLRSTNSGYTWTTEQQGGDILQSVSFVGADAIVGGRAETILALQSRFYWSGAPPIFQRPQLYGVDSNFLVPGLEIAVAGRDGILRTTDGGATWTQLSTGGASVYAVNFVDENSAIAVGTGIVLGTTDRGLTWQTRYVHAQRSPISVSFGDANTGMAAGFGHILRTTDGGLTWETIYVVSRLCRPWPFGELCALYSVSMASPTSAIAVGQGGTILRTTDGGDTWTLQTSPATYQDLRGVSFGDANTATAVGSNGIIIRTTDGGATWLDQSVEPLNYLSSVSMWDANTAMAPSGPGTIFKTIDGGATWTLQSTGQHRGLRSVVWVDANIWTAVGLEGIIVRTEAGGE